MKLALLLLLSTTAAFADDVKPTPLPEGQIDRAMIVAAMKQIQPDVMACGKKFEKVKGVVKVTVEVAPSGALAKTSVKQTVDDALGACVLAAVSKATFPATKSGGSFSYPYVF